MAEANAPVRRISDLPLFTLHVLAVGMQTALFLHYLDNGWPAPLGGLLPVGWVYPLMFVCYVWFIFGSILGYLGIRAELKNHQPTRSRGNGHG